MMTCNEIIKAAPSPSAVTDAEQPYVNTKVSISTEYQNCNTDLSNDDMSLEEAVKRLTRQFDPQYLHTVSMTELYQTVYGSKSAIIENLLYPGAYILAGTPKIGKSFLVAQIAYSISTGQKLWNYEVSRGPVLYLALEDDFQRLQGRLYRMFGIDDTPKLFLATAAKQIGSGLDTQLENFVKEHSGTKLIIVDTLQRVRESGGEVYSYANDYEIIGKLKTFADTHSLCVLIVHHTRKQTATDSFDMISGTTGLLGCADGAFLIQKEKRTSNSATLDIVGRDQADQKLYLMRDEETLKWTLEHVENELWVEPPDPLLEALSRLVSPDRPEWQGSATELSEALRLDGASNTLTRKLNILAGKLLNDYHIRYENSHSRSGSKIILTLTAQTA